MKVFAKVMASVLALGLGTAVASANSITVTQTGAVAVPGGSVWSYDLSFVNSTVNLGDFITINDFGPAVPVLVPVGWAFSQALSGPNSLPATDDAGILNATLTWTGPDGTIISPDSATTVVLGLDLQSPSDTTPGPLASYTTVDHVTSGDTAGTTSRVIGSVRTPIPQRQVPDGGSTVLLLGAALAGLGFIRRLA